MVVLLGVPRAGERHEGDVGLLNAGCVGRVWFSTRPPWSSHLGEMLKCLRREITGAWTKCFTFKNKHTLLPPDFVPLIWVLVFAPVGNEVFFPPLRKLFPLVFFFFFPLSFLVLFF